MTATAVSIKPPKTVYLIRHAESEENRRIAALSRTFKTLGRFSLPKSADVYASTELLHVQGQVDSNVSEIGAKQIAHMKQKLQQDDFVVSSGIQLVVHSPLLRARQTSEGMLGCLTAASAADGQISDLKAKSVKRVLQTNLLLEKTPSEWTPLYYAGFIQRIQDFEKWLWDQEEETVALVGHSQFFKAMLGLNFKFGNCEVWKVTFDPSKVVKESRVVPATTIDATQDEQKEDFAANLSHGNEWKLPPQWTNLEKKYTCDVASSSKTI
ncbi:histidine phosphatase superfamily branch 1 protein [Nitzschia inconspicua]|uniref:Histidine phosphatase superfamily branch 1 protein n=1 Tax=Nitzschia inconspicua TaxID=303405 RepID=A0A9K3KZ99_9STRA|nr:histidine phosphatase superfamily branch 1 protein [Nitzschia inconspicua]